MEIEIQDSLENFKYLSTMGCYWLQLSANRNHLLLGMPFPVPNHTHLFHWACLCHLHHLP